MLSLADFIVIQLLQVEKSVLIAFAFLLSSTVMKLCAGEMDQHLTQICFCQIWLHNCLSNLSSLLKITSGVFHIKYESIDTQTYQFFRPIWTGEIYTFHDQTLSFYEKAFIMWFILSHLNAAGFYFFTKGTCLLPVIEAACGR